MAGEPPKPCSTRIPLEDPITLNGSAPTKTVALSTAASLAAAPPEAQETQRQKTPCASVSAVTYPFLSDEWIAAVTEIGDRYKAEGLEASAAQQMKMNVNVNDVPFGDGTLTVGVDSTAGRMHFQRGEVSEPDVTVTTDYATARSILVDQDPQAAVQAFMSAKIRVQGNLMKLMQLQPEPGQVDSTTRSVAEEVRAITG